MKLLLKRTHLRDNYTIGNLYIDNEYFCDTLEDTTRDINKDGENEVKIWGKTSIPYGIYKVDITYSPKFKKEMPLLLSVPGFEGVSIHAGNTPDDTEGCILVGFNRKIGQVINSSKTFLELFEKIKTAKKDNNDIEIEII